MGKHEKRIGVKPFLDEQTQAHHKPVTRCDTPPFLRDQASLRKHQTVKCCYYSWSNAVLWAIFF
jgi:hypothetical protein